VAQLLAAVAAHALALVLYPGLLTCAVFGALAEGAWRIRAQAGEEAAEIEITVE